MESLSTCERGQAEVVEEEEAAMATIVALVLLLGGMLLSAGELVSAQSTFIVVNRCRFTIWPGMLGNSLVANGGFVLEPGQSTSVALPAHWSGRLWARSGCNFDKHGQGSCFTGDCGRGLHCNGAGGIPPATLAEFTLDGDLGKDFYDVSLVDGFNLPIRISPSGGSGACGSPSCSTDVNRMCPTELQVKSGAGGLVACKSACLKFQSAQYCCTGSFSTKCPPNGYSRIFKAACPSAYSYAEDDLTSTFTCTNPIYTITFCP